MKGVSVEAPFIVGWSSGVSGIRCCPPIHSSHSNRRSDHDRPGCPNRSNHRSRSTRPSRWSCSSHRSRRCRPSATSPTSRPKSSTSPMSRTFRSPRIPTSRCLSPTSLSVRSGRSGPAVHSERSCPTGWSHRPARPRRTRSGCFLKHCASCLRPPRRRRGFRPATMIPTDPGGSTSRTVGRPASRIGPTTHSSHSGSRSTSPSSCRDRSSGEPPSCEVDPRPARPPHRLGRRWRL